MPTPAPGRLQAGEWRRLHGNIPLCAGERYLIPVEKPFSPIEIAIDQHKAAADRHAKYLNDCPFATDKPRDMALSLMDTDTIPTVEIAFHYR
ncbi:MAG TPA: hypothetical protein VFU22_09235 [Roseiflexaceae bacterium]|nr:hypothetical protein [Roseiflexaceae bacterium]